MKSTNTQAMSECQQAGGLDMGAALRRAFNLGQTYWQQADSEYTSQHRKADETLARFNALVVEISAALSQPQAGEIEVEIESVGSCMLQTRRDGNGRLKVFMPQITVADIMQRVKVHAGDVPAGWKLVPAEPTLEMKTAMANAFEARKPDGTVAHELNRAKNAYVTGIALAPAAPTKSATACRRCNGTRIVDDGEITGVGGCEFSSGPIKCVTVCPDCTAPAPATQADAESALDQAMAEREASMPSLFDLDMERAA